MESFSRYLLVSAIVLFVLVFYRWLLRFLRRKDIQGHFPYLFPFSSTELQGIIEVKFELPVQSKVGISIHKPDGSFIELLLEKNYGAGLQTTTIDLSPYAAGWYELRVQFINQTTTRKIKISD
jgi:hypothetical protein